MFPALTAAVCSPSETELTIQLAWTWIAGLFTLSLGMYLGEMIGRKSQSLDRSQVAEMVKQHLADELALAHIAEFRNTNAEMCRNVAELCSSVAHIVEMSQDSKRVVGDNNLY
ncbi:hypothetical protein B0H11DRAFT_1905089 [Mycena galericulata]|nr:hypothetical protein B0H11DRAFT_1905089 [Mycena galericulata]